MNESTEVSKVALVFTVFNESKTIESFLRSLVSQSVLPTQIIAVDGGSTDGTAEIINRYFADLEGAKLVIDDTCNLKHSKGPIARGRNVAISQTDRELIAVTDGGCRLTEKWFENMIGCVKSDVDVVAGNYRAARGCDFQRKTARIWEPDLAKARTNPKRFSPSSRSLLFRHELWESVGGYPEDSFTAEDTKFVRDIYKISGKVVLCEDAVVEWQSPRNIHELRAKVERYGFGDGVHGLDKLKYICRALVLVTLPVSFWFLLAAGKSALTVPIYYYQVKGFLGGMWSK